MASSTASVRAEIVSPMTSSTAQIESSVIDRVPKAPESAPEHERTAGYAARAHCGHGRQVIGLERVLHSHEAAK